MVKVREIMVVVAVAAVWRWWERQQW